MSRLEYLIQNISTGRIESPISNYTRKYSIVINKNKITVKPNHPKRVKKIIYVNYLVKLMINVLRFDL